MSLIPPNDTKRIPLLMFAFVLCSSLVMFLVNTSNNAVEESRPTAAEFMEHVKHQQFERAKERFRASIDIETYFTGEGVVDSYKETAYGADSKSDVWITYYVTGRATETRNVSLRLLKENERWNIVDLQTSYHINRGDKALAMAFIRDMTWGNFNLAHRLADRIDQDRFQKIRDVMARRDIGNRWRVFKAINIPGAKASFPNTTKFYAKASETGPVLYIACKNLKGKNWIYDARIQDAE